jgi:hypothetical protein
MATNPNGRGIIEMLGFSDIINSLGGLLGFGGQQNPTMPASGPEFYAEGAAAGQATNAPRVPEPARPDPFARFSPEQRNALGLISIGDAFGAASGTPGSAAKNLMKMFDVQSGRGNPADLMPAMQQPQQQFAQVPGLLPMPAPQAPQTRSPMAMNLPRPVAIRVPSLLGR